MRDEVVRWVVNTGSLAVLLLLLSYIFRFI